MVDAENRDRWEDAQQVSWGQRQLGREPRVPALSSCAAPLGLCLQVLPGSVLLMKVVEDYIHLVGEALKAFQSSLIVTDNLGEGPEVGRRGLVTVWRGLGCGGLCMKCRLEMHEIFQPRSFPSPPNEG